MGLIDKEQQELLDDAYKNYCKHFMDEYLEKNELGEFYRNSLRPYPIEEFINKIKTDVEFSKTWGLKIEEGELSNDERFRIAYKNLELRKKLEAQSRMLHYPDGHNKVMDDANIPTKLITVTYNNETIESYGS